MAGAYQYANRTQKISSTNRTGFTEQLQKTGEAAKTSKVDAYTEYLRSKYGNVRIQSIGKDQKSLDRVGKSMSGSDVVIAPNILEQMANDPEKAAEEKAAERQAKRKERMEGMFTVSATSTDMKSVTQNIVAAVSGTSSPTGGSFDIKA